VSGLPYEAIKKKTTTDLRTIIQAAEIYRATQGRYPESLEEMKGAGLWRSPASLSSRRPAITGAGVHLRDHRRWQPTRSKPGKDGVEAGEKENEDFEEPAPPKAECGRFARDRGADPQVSEKKFFVAASHLAAKITPVRIRPEG